MVDNKQLIDKIVDLVGGIENINSVNNCMTRLRLKIANEKLVEHEKLKQTDGVMGVVDSDTLQVVVGPGKAKKLRDILVEDFGVSSDSTAQQNNWKDNKEY